MTMTNENLILILILILIIISILILISIFFIAMIIVTNHIIKMETILNMNTENSKTNEPHRFKLDLADKLNLKNPKMNIVLVNLSIYYTLKNIKTEYNNKKIKISTPTWNETFDLPDGSYTIYDIQDYFDFIIRKREALTDNPSTKIYSNKIKKRIVFKIKMVIS